MTTASRILRTLSRRAAVGAGIALTATARDGGTVNALLERYLLDPLEGCRVCHTLGEPYIYGLGVLQTGGWILQNPLFGGYANTAACHPSGDIAIAVATTFNKGSFDETGGYRFGKSGQAIFTEIGELLMPDDPPLLG